MSALDGMGRLEWQRVLRRVKMTPSTKLVGFVLATYANNDGSSAYPSVAKLVRVTGMSKRTVLRALDDLRGFGLIERTDRSRRRVGLADTHRLTVPDDLLDRCELLPPDESDPYQGARAAPDKPPDQGVDVAPVDGGIGAISAGDQVPPGTDQGAVVTRLGATSAPLHTPDQALTTTYDKGPHHLEGEESLVDRLEIAVGA